MVLSSGSPVAHAALCDKPLLRHAAYVDAWPRSPEPPDDTVHYEHGDHKARGDKRELSHTTSSHPWVTNHDLVADCRRCDLTGNDPAANFVSVGSSSPW